MKNNNPKDQNTKPRKKGKTALILTCMAAAVLAGGFMLTNVMGNTKSSAAVGFYELYRTELVDSISAKGMVESVNKSNVYSTLGYTVKTVEVEVGDKVTEGQVLCRLDTEDLELNIAQQKSELEVTRRNNSNQLDNNRRIYNEATENLNQGSNTQVLNAEASLKTAELNLENAAKSYNDALSDYSDGTNSSLVTAESNLTNAKLDLETKEKEFENNRLLVGAGAISTDSFTQSETAYTNALNKYNDALVNLENTRISVERSLEQAESSLKSAQTSYDNAVAALDAARLAAGQELEKYQNNVLNAEISSNVDSKMISIQKLEKQLEDSTVRSPINGTVTAVYAKEGAAGTGLLFVVEDTEELQIRTKIKEYDAGKVSAGMVVVIKSDSTGDAVFDGVISKVDPAAVKNSLGETDSSSDVEFGATVSVNDTQNPLRIGMNTRLTIILERKTDAYYVPYDSVTTNENSESIVYTVTGNPPAAKQIKVSTGMETDFYVEISGDGLEDGMKVLGDASVITDGMPVTLE